MQRFMRLIVTLLILLGLLLIAPFGMGFLVEKRFHKLLKESLVHLEAYPNAEFKLLSYKRGWFKSEAEGTLSFKNLKIDGKVIEPIIISFHDYVKHGPVIITREPSGKPNFWIGQALSKAYIKKISGIQVTPLPLEIGETAISFRGELKTVIYAENLKVDFANFNLALAGLKDHLEVSANRKGITNHLELKSAILTDNLLSQKIDLKKLETSADLTKNQQGLWLGDKKLEIDSLVLMLNGKTYTLKGLYNKTRSFEHDNQIRLDVRLNIRSAGEGDKMFGPHRLVLDIDGIDASVLSKLNDTFMTLSHEKYNYAKTQNPAVPTTEALKNEVLLNKIADLTADLIKKGFTVEVKSLEVATVWGVLNASSRIQLPNLGANSSKTMIAPSPLSMLSSLLNMDSSLNAEIPAGLVKKVFETRYRKIIEGKFGGQLPEAERQSISDLADKHVAKLVADGWFIPKEDKYEIKLSFKNGEFLVNAKPLKPQGILPELAPLPAAVVPAPIPANIAPTPVPDGIHPMGQTPSAANVPVNSAEGTAADIAQNTPTSSSDVPTAPNPEQSPAGFEAPLSIPAENSAFIKNDAAAPSAIDEQKQ